MKMKFISYEFHMRFHIFNMKIISNMKLFQYEIIISMQTVVNGLYQNDKRELIYGIIYLIGTKIKKIQLHNKNQIKIFAF